MSLMGVLSGVPWGYEDGDGDGDGDDDGDGRKKKLAADQGRKR